jgi:hypothetical protein
MARWYPTPLFRDLIDWCRVKLPAAVSAIEQRPHDDAWRDRCLAAMVRAGAEADPAWLFYAVEGDDWRELRRLGPKIVQAAGYPVRGTFADWVDDVRAAAGVGTPPDTFTEPEYQGPPTPPTIEPAKPAAKPSLFEVAA